MRTARHTKTKASPQSQRDALVMRDANVTAGQRER
jgi:hypothetical protein